MTGLLRTSGLGLLLAVFLTGCQTAPEDARIPVAGTVFLGDKPVDSGAVILRPDAAKGNSSKHEPRGKIEANGKFQVETALQQGAPAGWYKVGVIVTEPADPKAPYAVLKSLIAGKYNDPDTSGLAFEVDQSPRAGAYDLKLDPKASNSP